MSRPRKKGIDYFPFDVDFFSDKKVRILKSRYGADGITIFIYLLCEIYRNGFYIQMDDDYEYIIADDLGMSHDKVKQVLKFLLERSLLDNTLFQSDTIITSQGIQRRFQEAVKSRASKSKIEVDSKYWLLTEQETQPFIKCTHNRDYSEKNHDYSEKNHDYSEKNDAKKSKGKKSKGKKSIYTASTEEGFEKFWSVYPKQKSRFLAEQAYVQLIVLGIESSDLMTAAENYAEACRIKNTPQKYISEPANWLNQSKWVDYTEENYERPELEREVSGKNKFQNFDQRSYDYEDLEKQLLQKGSG